MLLLKIVDVVCQEGLVIAQLLTNWHQANLVHCAFSAHGLQREKELFADIRDLSRKRSPFRLGLDQSTLGVLFFLLEHHVMLLEEHELLFELLKLDIL